MRVRLTEGLDIWVRRRNSGFSANNCAQHDYLLAASYFDEHLSGLRPGRQLWTQTNRAVTVYDDVAGNYAFVSVDANCELSDWIERERHSFGAPRACVYLNLLQLKSSSYEATAQ